jgi:hypothetical protein
MRVSVTSGVPHRTSGRPPPQPAARNAGGTGGRGQRREARGILIVRQQEMKRALVCRSILRHLHVHDRGGRKRAECHLEPAHRRQRLRQQLPGRGRVAPLARALAKEPEATVDDVQARAHAIAMAGRPFHGKTLIEWQSGNAGEGIADDVALERQLPLVAHVREHGAAAGRVAGINAVG